MYFTSSTGGAANDLIGSRLSSSATVPMTLAERNADQVIYREDPSLAQMSGSTSQVYVQVAPNTHTEETRKGPTGQLITHTETRETLNPLITPAQSAAPAVIREEKLPATVSTRAYEVFRKDPSTVFPNSKIISVNQPGPVTTPSGSVYDPATNTITSAFNGQVTVVQPALHIGSTLQRYPDMATSVLQPVVSSAAGYSMNSSQQQGVTFAPGLTTTLGPPSGYMTTSSMSSGYAQQPQHHQQLTSLSSNNPMAAYANQGYGATYVQPTFYTNEYQQQYRGPLSYASDMPTSVYEQQPSNMGGTYTVQNRGGVTTQHYESGPITTTTTWGGDSASGYDGGYTTTTYSEEQTRKTFSSPHPQLMKGVTNGMPTPMTQYTATPVTQYTRQPSVQN